MNTRLAPQVAPAADSDDAGRQWFVSSGSQDGVWYRVTYRAERLGCSCLAGRLAVMRQNFGEVARSCRHLVAVVEFEQARAAQSVA
jgi:hypothetical protein